MSYTSPQFLTALSYTDISRNTLRLLAKEIPIMIIFEACAKREISPKEAADILILQRESNYWIARLFYKYLVFDHK